MIQADHTYAIFQAHVQALELLADQVVAERAATQMKPAVIRSIPRRALLKPEHVKTRLQNQHFNVGDRVIMAAESGNVPLCVKGTVVGIQPALIDVLWDSPFIGGTTLAGRFVMYQRCSIVAHLRFRCSAYRGLEVSPTTILNLSNPQVRLVFRPRSVYG